MTVCAVAEPPVFNTIAPSTATRQGYAVADGYLWRGNPVATCTCPKKRVRSVHCVGCAQKSDARWRSDGVFLHTAQPSNPHSWSVGRLQSYHVHTPSRHETDWGHLIGNWKDWDNPVLPSVAAWRYYTYDACGARRSQRTTGVSTAIRDGYGWADGYLWHGKPVETVCTCPKKRAHAPRCIACCQKSNASTWPTRVFMHTAQPQNRYGSWVGKLQSYGLLRVLSEFEVVWGRLMGHWPDEDNPIRSVLPVVHAWRYYTYDASGALRWQRSNGAQVDIR